MKKVESNATGAEENGAKSIEESFELLEGILSKLEDEETGLEESFALYEQGIRLVRGAEKSIEKIEKKIKIIEAEEAGEEEA